MKRINKLISNWVFLLSFTFCVLFLFAQIAQNKEIDSKNKVIFISIDGLRSDALTFLGPEHIPNFYLMMRNGVFTLNARTDSDFTNTLPNHTSMLTARPVLGQSGHHINFNEMTKITIHDFNDCYIPSIFDAVKKNGLTTALISSKPKFSLFLNSYNSKSKFNEQEKNNTPKIDHSFISLYNDDASIVFLKDILINKQADFTFLHLASCDLTGHKFGWDVSDNSQYLLAVKYIDSLLGQIIQVIQRNKELSKSTTIIITSDHGGEGFTHLNIKDNKNFTIPFIVWGAEKRRGEDLYEMNTTSRQDPGIKQISYSQTPQPIRNSDGANLSLSILSLNPIEKSIINVSQDLNIKPNNL